MAILIFACCMLYVIVFMYLFKFYTLLLISIAFITVFAYNNMNIFTYQAILFNLMASTLLHLYNQEHMKHDK